MKIELNQAAFINNNGTYNPLFLFFGHLFLLFWLSALTMSLLKEFKRLQPINSDFYTPIVEFFYTYPFAPLLQLLFLSKNYLESF